VALVLAGGVGSARAAVTDYPVPTPHSELADIAAGSDGAMWFTEAGSGVNKIGRVTPDGTFTEYVTPTPRPSAITAGPDGALWYTMLSAWKIGRIDTSGAITEYPFAQQNAPVAGFSEEAPRDITAGPDGALWFVQGFNYGGSIGRMATDGTYTRYPLQMGSKPVGITAGPDGALWFVEVGTNKVGRITTSGSISEYPTPGSQPLGITAGPDGAIWFTDTTSGGQAEFVRMTTDGAVTAKYPWQVPGSPAGSHSAASGLTAGPDGALWFLGGGDTVGRLTTTGAFSYDFLSNGDRRGLTAITPGPSGTLWFADLGSNTIGRIVPGDETATRPEPGTPPPGGEPPSGGGNGAAAVLGTALGPVGRTAKIAAILNAGGYLASLDAPGPGKAKVVWYRVPKGAHIAAKRKPIVVASGALKTTRPGAAQVKIKLSKAGRALLKKAKTLKLTAKGSFKPDGKKTRTAKKVFKLKR
jgi:virginiamycin B lyase